VTVTDQSEVEKIDQRISSAQQIKPTRSKPHVHRIQLRNHAYGKYITFLIISRL